MIGTQEQRKRKDRISRLRNKVFNDVYGNADFNRLWSEAPAMKEIGYGIFGRAYYEITDDLYDRAESELSAILGADR